MSLVTFYAFLFLINLILLYSILSIEGECKIFERLNLDDIKYASLVKIVMMEEEKYFRIFLISLLSSKSLIYNILCGINERRDFFIKKEILYKIFKLKYSNLFSVFLRKMQKKILTIFYTF